VELADDALAAWVAEVRRTPPAPLDVAALRRPRERPPGPELDHVEDLVAPGDPPVRVRLYRPGAEPRPLVVYVHGGGFVFGDLESHDRACRRLARLADAAVLAVDVRRAPEHPAPAAIADAVAAATWRPDALGALTGTPALAGDSSGGTVALLAARELAARGTPASALWLACPNADLTLSQPSVREKGHGWGLDAAALAWFVAQWLPAPTPAALARFSPLHTDLAGLPPTLLATAEHDPLRDEGTALAARLRAAGVIVELVPGPGLVHGFLTLDSVSPAARTAGDALMRRLGAMLPRVSGPAPGVHSP
jgi:acetyl esterase